jgi:hypothetical protein
MTTIRRALATQFALAIALPYGTITAQARLPCSRADDISIRSVSIMGRLGLDGTLVKTDTLWVPSEGRLQDSIYIQVVLRGPEQPYVDSVFVAATIQLLVANSATKQNAVPFPTRLVKDTIVADRPPRVVLLGPFSTNELVPWPGIAVNSTPNALLIGASALSWVLPVYRAKGRSCREQLDNNAASSRSVKLEFAY